VTMNRKTDRIFCLFSLALIGIILLPVMGSAVASGIDIRSKETAGQVIVEEAFQEAFEQFLSHQPELVNSEVVISKFKVLRNGPVSDGDVDIQLIRTNNRPLSRLIRLKAVVSVDGVPENNAQISAWLDVFKEVACAARNLEQGRVLKPSDFYLERRNVSRDMDEAVSDTGRLAGLMAKHNFRKGDMLKHWMVEKKPVVQRGDQVTILVESGLLRVTIPGKVLDDGFAGETVSVENSMSNKKIFARVVDAVTVRVDI
jgi:flagellar basal body P-ring formation protein FlgA